MASPNTFAGSPLDRAGDLRNDPDWLAEQEANPQARALVLWEGRPLLGEDGGLVWLSLAHARDIVPDRDLFLGLDGEAPVFAVEIEGSADPAEGPLKGAGAFSDLRSAAAVLPGAEAAMAGAAKSLFDWRRRHGFCPACGIESRTAAGGWKRKCPACGTEHFPRVDPVVIMLPVFNGGPEPLCLLGRQPSWPPPTTHSEKRPGRLLPAAVLPVPAMPVPALPVPTLPGPALPGLLLPDRPAGNGDWPAPWCSSGSR